MTKDVVVFRGRHLPASFSGDLEVIPLKPIAEEVGVSWAGLWKKLKQNDAYFSRIFGVCVCDFLWLGQVRKLKSIRIDRVSPFILTINPRRVRAGGNVSAADAIEEMHSEWVDALTRRRHLI